MYTPVVGFGWHPLFTRRARVLQGHILGQGWALPGTPTVQEKGLSHNIWCGVGTWMDQKGTHIPRLSRYLLQESHLSTYTAACPIITNVHSTYLCILYIKHSPLNIKFNKSLQSTLKFTWNCYSYFIICDYFVCSPDLQPLNSKFL